MTPDLGVKSSSPTLGVEVNQSINQSIHLKKIPSKLLRLVYICFLKTRFTTCWFCYYSFMPVTLMLTESVLCALLCWEYLPQILTESSLPAPFGFSSKGSETQRGDLTGPETLSWSRRIRLVPGLMHQTSSLRFSCSFVRSEYYSKN